MCGLINPVSGNKNSYFKEYVESAERFLGYQIREIRCDNGGEYKNKNFSDYCSGKGIELNFTARYSPKLNGVAERFNRTKVEKIVTMMYDSGLPKELWDEALLTATYFVNRSLTAANNFIKVSAECWYREKQNVKNLKIFGSPVHFVVPTKLRRKLDDRSDSYKGSGYFVWNEKLKSVLYERDIIKFCENEMYYKVAKLNQKSNSISGVSENINIINLEDEEKFWIHEAVYAINSMTIDDLSMYYDKIFGILRENFDEI